MTRRLARFDNCGRELSDASSRARVDSIDRSSYAEEHSAFALTPPPSAERFPDTFCIHAAKGDKGDMSRSGEDTSAVSTVNRGGSSSST